ncbi:MAG TPA: sigma-70 family RNA polymerase sigma factor [Spongiibacteraceae bacterium]|nr:sigma-70 family RNA polymerase sigma factor [Spongiibacteraceae bacterium]
MMASFYKTVAESASRKVTPIHDAKNAEDDIWRDCLRQVAQQDRAAFARLFKHFAPQIKAFGLSTIIPDRSGQFADELVQEVMVAIWRKATSYDAGKSAAATWIFTIARNKRIDLLRKLKRHAGMLDIDDIWPLEDEAANPFQMLQQRSTEQRVRESLQSLPVAQREAIALAFIEGKSHSEIAETLHLPLGTVKSRIRLAMQRLQLVLER